MHRTHHIRFLLLAGSTVAALASAQEPQPGPSVADSPAQREHVDASDAQLGLEVQSRLYQELGVSNLSAIVRYGVVTLDGTVREEAELKRAEEIALQIRGVHSVINELTLKPPLSVAVADEAAAVRDRE